MKKNLFLAMAAMTVLAGCSKDEAPQINQVELSDVAIQLSTDASLPSINMKNTRAALTAWDNTQVGIYAFEKKEEWQVASSTATPNLSCILNKVTGTINSAGKVTLQGAPYYYPFDTKYNYSFYGYYPASGTPVVAENKLTVTFDDYQGTDDLIWGMAEVTTPLQPGNLDGYNARYIRKGGAVPQLQFKHSMASLRLHIKEGEDANNLNITNITLKNVPNSIQMVVADRDGDTEGTILEAPEYTGTYSLPLSINTSTPETTYEAGEIFFPVLNGVYQEPLSSDGDKRVYLEASITVQSGKSFEKTTVLPFIIRSPQSKTQEAGWRTTFETGKYYDVNITVNGGKEITLTANLVPMENGGETNPEV